MNVHPGGGCSSLLGQGVCLIIAPDARVGSDFVEVGGGSMADSLAEEHLQGLEEGKVLRFKDGLGLINESVEEVQAAKAVCVDGHVAAIGMVQQGLSKGHQFSPVDGDGVCQSTRVDEDGQFMGGGVNPCPSPGDPISGMEAPISVVGCCRLGVSG